jgi:hypothetical protein
MDWTQKAAKEIVKIDAHCHCSTIDEDQVLEILKHHIPIEQDAELAAPAEIMHSLVLEFKRILSEDEWRTAVNIAKTVPGVQGLRAEAERRDGPLLQCIDCRNTESPAGAMARQFNHGRCLHCGGFFKVVRA